jgi:hypothetical protein
MKLSLIILATALTIFPSHPASAMQAVEPNPKPNPKELAETARAEYQLALEEVEKAKADHREARQLRDQFIKTANESAEEQLLLEQIGRMENEIAENALISEANILSLLTARRVELIIDIAGLNAKLEHVLKLDSDQRADRSEIGEKIVQAQQQQLVLAQEKLSRVNGLHSAGNVPQAEVKEAELDVAKAELALLEKRKALEQPRKAEAQVEIGLELAEKKSQLKTVQELLEQAASIRKSVAELTEAKTRWYQIRSAREYGTMETLKEVEKDLTHRRLNELISQQRLQELETKEQENEDQQK